MKDLDLGKMGKNRTVPNLKGISKIVSPKNIPRRPKPLNEDYVVASEDTEERLTSRVNRINSFSPVFAATHGNFRTTKNRDKKQFTANNPIPSPVAKDKKNPLVNSSKSLSNAQKNDLIKILSERNNELYALNKEKSELEAMANRLQGEAKKLRKVKGIYRDKEKQVANLQSCLQLAMEESEELRKELQSREDSRGGISMVEGLSEEVKEEPKSNASIGSLSNPKRRWVGPSVELTSKMDKFKVKLADFLATRASQ